MRRALITLGMAMLLIVGSAAAGSAMSFHFKSAGFGPGSLVFSGTAVGLANAEYLLELEATATVTAMCENKGGHQAPGRNAIGVSASDSASILTDQNGTDSVVVQVDDPTTADFGEVPPSNKEAGCPGGKWSIVDLVLDEWTAAHLVVTVVATGEVVFDQLYDCSGAGATLQCSAA